MILFIDNFDSFVHNLARHVRELHFKTTVRRNNDITLAEIETLKPTHIIISPGPCAPQQAGISMEVIRHFGQSVPILGVCLGHQAIGEVYGGRIERAKRPMHGKASSIYHHASSLFQGLPSPLQVGRYHSLIVSEQGLPEILKVTARCEEGEIMGLQHSTYPVFGVQFHPESVLTDHGYQLLSHFLAIKP